MLTAPPVIRYGGVVAGQEEIDAVTEILRGQGWASGEKTAEFEKAAARAQGCKHALFVNSGSSGLLLAMATLPRGSKIAMPALQFPTLYSAAKWCELRPVLVDVDDSLNMDPAALERVIAPGNVQAAAFVHMAGNPSNIKDVWHLCATGGVKLVEDICEAFGTYVPNAGRRAGSFGNVSVTSTHAAHQISTGEGGLVFTDDDRAYARMRSVRDWGRAYDDAMLPGYYPGYVFSRRGLNLHATDIQAALGLVQLTRLNSFIERRRANYEALRRVAESLPVTLLRIDPGFEPSWYAFPFLTDYREDLIMHLAARGIESRPIVAGNMARQPVCQEFDPEAFPVADDVFRRGLWVSVHPRLTAGDIGRITTALEEFFA